MDRKKALRNLRKTPLPRMGPKLSLNADAETMDFITLFFGDDILNDITSANSYVDGKKCKTTAKTEVCLD
jgi:hypothetical protein